RRAILAKSEGDKQSRINESEGRMRELINISEGEMQRRINNAEGKAEEIITLAQATADGIKKMAKVVSAKGGEDAIKLKMSQKYFSKIGNLADAKTKVIIPANLTDYKAWLKNLELTID
ncbi:MAG: regulator of protease activity HflC (stomatin/prohibitin superfamily), partial [Thermoproteota archaeon]